MWSSVCSRPSVGSQSEVNDRQVAQHSHLACVAAPCWDKGGENIWQTAAGMREKGCNNKKRRRPKGAVCAWFACHFLARSASLHTRASWQQCQLQVEREKGRGETARSSPRFPSLASAGRTPLGSSCTSHAATIPSFSPSPSPVPGSWTSINACPFDAWLTLSTV